METRRKRRTVGVYTVLGITLLALALSLVASVYYYRLAAKNKQDLENTYLRAFHDMADYVNDIDAGLKKMLLAKDAVQMSALSSRLQLQAEGAKDCLAQMPTENAVFDNTSRFLSQVGEYCASLSGKVIRGDTVSEEEYGNVSQLSAYAEAVNQEFSQIETQVYENGIGTQTLWSSPFVVRAGNTFSDSMDRLENMPQDYPSLIYDGPFSDHLEQAEPVALQGKERISRNMAEQTVSAFLGAERASLVQYTGDGAGKIETYLFEGGTSPRNISMEVTKYGGQVLWMLDSRQVTESRLNVAQAMAAGEQFLIKCGYSSMQSSYYETANHVATINYAYRQGGTIMYPDLVKVKIAMDNGEILGFESKGYQMCHTSRVLPDEIITEAEAIAAAGNHLAIDRISMAVIPTDGGKEVYCYELKGTLGKQNFLVYVNAKTGVQEKILLLTETENGILTI